MIIDITRIIDELTVLRDTFKSKREEISRQYKESQKYLKENFIANSVQYQAEEQRIKQEYQERINEARANATNFLITELDKLREVEISRVQKVDIETLQKINAVSNIPVTAEEISILQRKYDPTGNNYWVGRFLADLAERNGIPGIQINNGASIETKLDVLQQLEDQAKRMISEYDPDKHDYRIHALLADSVLMRAENVYTGGWKMGELEDEQVARRAFLQLKGQNTISQGIGLMNILRNANNSLKNALFYEISNGGKFSESALEWAGCLDEYNAFLDNHATDYRNAKQAMQKLRTTEDEKEFSNVVKDMYKNDYFRDMFSREKSENITINEKELMEKNSRDTKLIDALNELGRGTTE